MKTEMVAVVCAMLALVGAVGWQSYAQRCVYIDGDTLLPIFSTEKPLIADGDSIAFLGDSITEAGNYPNGYINLFLRALELNGVKVTKYPAGVAGERRLRLPWIPDRDARATHVQVLRDERRTKG